MSKYNNFFFSFFCVGTEKDLRQNIYYVVNFCTQIIILSTPNLSYKLVTFQVNGRKVRGRQYPWGFVEVDNPVHSDFALLRKFLIQTHMQDLKDVTHDVHYENYRYSKSRLMWSLFLNLTKNDHFNRMITITRCFYRVLFRVF
jgi:hypothetical protein